MIFDAVPNQEAKGGWKSGKEKEENERSKGRPEALAEKIKSDWLRCQEGEERDGSKGKGGRKWWIVEKRLLGAADSTNRPVSGS